MTVYDGEDDFVEDTGLSFTSSYDYRLQAWNALGHSNFTLVTGVRPQTSGCSMSVTLSFSSIMSGITNFFTVITVLVFAYRVRQYARVGGLGAFLMPAAQTYMKYSKSTGTLLRTRTGACEASLVLVAGLCAGMHAAHGPSHPHARYHRLTRRHQHQRRRAWVAAVHRLDGRGRRDA